jgi:hypothetical protein
MSQMTFQKVGDEPCALRVGFFDFLAATPPAVYP